MEQKKPKDPTVTLREEVFAFFVAEARKIHDLCDIAGVPTHVDGEKLSMAQRVEVVVLANEVVREAISKARGGNSLH